VRVANIDWEPTGKEMLPWRQLQRGGTREDRMLSEIEAAIPPFIAGLTYGLTGVQIQESERALIEIGGMDAEASGTSAEMARFMIRTESVASSKIERVTASVEDFARAIGGSRANSSANSMVSASAAIGLMVEAAGTKSRIELEDILAAHYTLMVDDPDEGPYAGTLRKVQNWVGGSDYSPRGALHVPPAPARVVGLMDDLVTFVNRDDVPVLAQAAIAHAQFETIHPFGDGNGRVGRALISAILRRRGITRNTIVPIASGLNALRDEYFAALNHYRAGSAAPLLMLIAQSAGAAGAEGQVTVRRVLALPNDWRNRVRPRVGSAASKLIPGLFQEPVLTARRAEEIAESSTPRTYDAIRRLEAEGIVHEITGRKRDRVWVASEVMAELGELDQRILARLHSAH
jgi:Fic family protein